MAPTVEWFGVTILEPTTMITDFAITATGWWAAWRLLTTEEHRRHRCRKLWAVGLFFVGLGAALGGIRHGFAVYLGDLANTVVWKGTVYAIGLSLVFVIYYYGPAMLAVAAIQGWAFARHRSEGALGIMSGVVVTLLGAIAQQSGISIHAHFNHNDLFHIIQVVGLALFFRGVSALRARAPAGCDAHPA